MAGCADVQSVRLISIPSSSVRSFADWTSVSTGLPSLRRGAEAAAGASLAPADGSSASIA